MLGIIGALAGIVSIIGGLASIYQALKPPKIPKIEIPKIDTAKVQEHISKMTQISDQARQTILNAISRYNAGQLSPEMKAKLDTKYQELQDKLLSSFAQRGISPDSPLAQKALSQLEGWYQQQYYTLLGQDLRNALQMTGLAEADINALINITGAQSNITQAYSNYAQALSQIGAQRGAGLASGAGLISGGLSEIAKNWGQGGGTSNQGYDAGWWSWD